MHALPSVTIPSQRSSQRLAVLSHVKQSRCEEGSEADDAEAAGIEAAEIFQFYPRPQSFQEQAGQRIEQLQVVQQSRSSAVPRRAAAPRSVNSGNDATLPRTTSSSTDGSEPVVRRLLPSGAPVIAVDLGTHGTSYAIAFPSGVTDLAQLAKDIFTRCPGSSGASSDRSVVVAVSIPCRSALRNSYHCRSREGALSSPCRQADRPHDRHGRGGAEVLCRGTRLQGCQPQVRGAAVARGRLPDIRAPLLPVVRVAPAQLLQL